MQDEILKHTKKIYKEVKNPKHTVAEKLKEIIVEILIIVFAVTLSIWLHSWSEEKHQRKEAKTFLIGLKEDLKNDQYVEYYSHSYNMHHIGHLPYKKKIETMKEGIIPIYEPGLEVLFLRNIVKKRLSFTTNLRDAVRNSEVIFLCLPTPQGGDGAADGL